MFMSRKILMYSMLLVVLIFASACGGKKASPAGDAEAIKTEQEIAAQKKREQEEAERRAREEAERRAREEAKLKAEEEAKKVMLVAPLEGEDDGVLNLDPIYFAYDQSELTEEAKSSLEVSYEWMQENPDMNILIAGHADERGSEEYNLGLGERRSKTVLKYLLSLGANKERFEVISFGEERPQMEGSTEEAWSKNRRVEFSK